MAKEAARVETRCLLLLLITAVWCKLLSLTAGFAFNEDDSHSPHPLMPSSASWPQDVRGMQSQGEFQYQCWNCCDTSGVKVKKILE